MANQHKRWTESDQQYLINNYYSKTLRQISEDLGFNISTICNKAKKIGLSTTNFQWTPEQIDYIKENYMCKTYKEMAKHLKKSTTTIAVKLKELNLRGIKAKTRNWSNEEITILKNNIDSKSYEAIAKLIGRTTQSVIRKANDLGIIDVLSKGFYKLKKDQINFILANYDKMTDTQMAIKFGVNESSIVSIRRKYDIKKTGNEVKGPTSIETFMINLLTKLDVDFIFNEYLGEYRPDFQMIGTKILIEVNGDYFHCNPYLYKDGPKDEIQIKHVLRDYYKKCYYLSQGYKIVTVWEREINEDQDKVKNKIAAVLSQKLQETQDY